MSQITKCTGKKKSGKQCPLRLKCNRFMAPYAGSTYCFEEAPFTITGNKQGLSYQDAVECKWMSVVENLQNAAEAEFIIYPPHASQKANARRTKVATPEKKPENYQPFQIEDAIPIPPSAKQSREGKWPWKRLQIGQSFFVRISDETEPGKKAPSLEEVLARMKQRGANVAKGLDMKFVCAIVPRNHEDPKSEMVIRIWRVEKDKKEEKGEAKA